MKIRSLVRWLLRTASLGLLLGVLSIPTTNRATAADATVVDQDQRFRARLSGFQEVHFAAGPPAVLRGAISSTGQGEFQAVLDGRADVITYELTYSGLEADVTQAHIHFGQRHTVGAIVVWLCQTAGTPAPDSVANPTVTPFCPEGREGTVTGTITPAQVLTATGQGLEAGEFDELVRAMQSGATYANVHSMLHTPGEIRGQIRLLRRRQAAPSNAPSQSPTPSTPGP